MASEQQTVVTGPTTVRPANIEALRDTKRVYERSRTMSFPDAQQFEVAMLHELSYQTDAAWIRKALEQFKQRSYRPGLTPFKEE